MDNMWIIHGYCGILWYSYNLCYVCMFAYLFTFIICEFQLSQVHQKYNLRLVSKK